MALCQWVIARFLAFLFPERLAFPFRAHLSETIESQKIIIIYKKHNVMIKKHYEIPESELLTVRFEESILSDGTWDKSIRPGTTWYDDDDDDFGLE